MKKTATLLLSASILLSSYAYAEEDKVLATYKNGKITESQITEKFKEALGEQQQFKDKKYSDLDSEMQSAFLNAFITSKLLEEEAKKSDVVNSKPFQEKLNTIKQQLVQQELIDSFIRTNLTDQMIDNEYNILVSKMTGKSEVKVSHILVDDEAKAKEAKKKLNKGAKFANIVNDYSKDQSTKARGGTLGYVVEGQLVPEFETKAFSMKSGEISDPVQTSFGWHIIKVEDKRDVKIPSKEEAKPTLKNKLSQELAGKFIEELKKKMELKIN